MVKKLIENMETIKYPIFVGIPEVPDLMELLATCNEYKYLGTIFHKE